MNGEEVRTRERKVSEHARDRERDGQIRTIDEEVVTPD